MRKVKWGILGAAKIAYGCSGNQEPSPTKPNKTEGSVRFLRRAQKWGETHPTLFGIMFCPPWLSSNSMGVSVQAFLDEVAYFSDNQTRTY